MPIYHPYLPHELDRHPDKLKIEATIKEALSRSVMQEKLGPNWVTRKYMEIKISKLNEALAKSSNSLLESNEQVISLGNEVVRLREENTQLAKRLIKLEAN